jgi:hypothetical protein
MISTRFLAALLGVWFFVSGSLHADTVDDYVNHEIQARHIPGMVIVVLKDGVVVKEKAYGIANLEFARISPNLIPHYRVATFSTSDCFSRCGNHFG